MPQQHILITAGPTREPIDPVRFISNRSSGKMGYALAEAAITAGHRVTLISGPVHLTPPSRIRFYRIETAKEMRAIVLREAKRSDMVIMAAAVADYQPVKAASQKIKKGALVLRLKKTPDILAELGRKKRKGQILVGFAAETHHLLHHAKMKLKAKNLDFIAANKVGVKGSGFDSDHNQITVFDSSGQIHAIPKMVKKNLAHRLIRIFLSSTIK